MADTTNTSPAPEPFRMLLLGATGLGKTTRLEQLDPEFKHTFLLDIEGGLRSCSKAWRDAGKAARRIVPTAKVAQRWKISEWDAIKRLVAYAIGADPLAPAGADYSAEVVANMETVMGGPFAQVYHDTRYVVMDSLNEAGARMMIDLEARKLDGWKKFEFKAEEIKALRRRFSASDPMHVVVTGKTREGNEKRRVAIDVDGGNGGVEFVEGFDEVVELVDIDVLGGKPERVFLCRQPNRLGRPFLKNRSKSLDTIEASHLGQLVEKILHGEPKAVIPTALPAGLSVDY